MAVQKTAERGTASDLALGRPVRASAGAAPTAGKPAEAHEGAAAEAWRRGDAASALTALESAYGLYHQAGDARSAARVATVLALDYEAQRGETAVSAGWLQRARRHLESLEPGPEHAWLAVWEAHLALLYLDDLETANRCIGEARALARRLDLSDVELMSLALEGVALVSRCELSEGMRRLDEVTAAAVGGGMQHISAAGNASCYLLTACERVRDFDRASQWFEKVRLFFERSRFVPGQMFCRDHLVGILLWRGAWAEAEAEIEEMIREAERMAPRFAQNGYLRLGTLRVRQGRFAEASDLFDRAESLPAVWLGRAAMSLAGGGGGCAAGMSDRFLRRLPPHERLERASGLEMLARARAAYGLIPDARAALAELQEIAKAAPTEGIRAAVCGAEGAVALAEGDFETARRALEDAVDLCERTGGVFEAARARIDLARALAGLRQIPEAEREARAGLAKAESLGALPEAERARALLAELFPESPEGSAGSALAGLTRREGEVLALVAEGLSNAEIGGRLFVSEHTVKRHVANILRKLDLSSRAAAAARFASAKPRPD